MTGVATTTDTIAASIIQSRHRIPEERLREYQILVLQVPDPEPLRHVQPDLAKARDLHAEADYALMWLGLYEQLVRYETYTGGSSYPVVVHQRYIMAPSPIPRWDNPALHQAAHLTILAAGREKRLYVVPPYTDVRSLEFDDVPFQVESQAGRVCEQTGATNKFMNVIPQPDGSERYRLSDTGYAEKLVRRNRGEPAEIGETYYDAAGQFYLDGVLKRDQHSR
jgi:alpha-D-ribose 1-methylphosphonate 5-phosphate C-P lyase